MVNLPIGHLVTVHNGVAAPATPNGEVIQNALSPGGTHQWLTVHVEGVTTGTVKVQGRCVTRDVAMPWVDLEVVDLNDSTNVDDEITADGLYRANVAGISELRVPITSNTTGTVYVVAHLTT